MFPQRIDEQLTFKQLEQSDAARLFELTEEGRTYLGEWLPWVAWTNEVKDSAKFIEIATEQAAKNNGFQAGIMYEGELVGVIGLHYVDWMHKKTSIGYWLGEAYQRKGIMTRVTKALIQFCYEQYELNRIEIRAVPTNRKSCSIPERLNFTLEGTLRANELLNGQYYDHNVYSMLKEDWLKEATR